MKKDALTDVGKLRLKVGPHEFEAEGSRDLIAAHLTTWQQLIAAQRTFEQNSAAAQRPPAGVQAGTPAQGDVTPLEIFALDKPRKLIALRVYPAGKAQHADAALLILYGYRQYFGDEAQVVGVVRLKMALAASGHPNARVDQTLARHVSAHLVAKAGRRKGSTYQLTTTGYQRAGELARALQASLTAGTKAVSGAGTM